MKNILKSRIPAGELHSVIANINCIHKLMRNLVETTDQHTFFEHKEWMLDAFDLLIQQVVIATAYCEEVMDYVPASKAKKPAAEALQ